MHLRSVFEEPASTAKEAASESIHGKPLSGV